MSSAKLLLVDLDGTCRRPLANPDGFIQNPQDQAVIPEAQAALARFVADGWRVVGVTNQGGVGAGHKSVGDCVDEQLRTLELIPELLAIYACPDAPGTRGDTCYTFTRDWGIETHHRDWSEFRGYRKPNPSMLELAIDAHGLWPDDGGVTLFVGDRPEGQGAASAAHVPFLWARDWWQAEPKDYQRR